MSRKYTKTRKKSAQEKIAYLRQDFFASFLANMTMPAGVNLHPPMVCWLDPNGHINHLRVHAYMQPHAGMPDRPLIPRLYVNHYALDNPERIARRMGWQLSPKKFDEQPRWGFELSLLPSELADFVPWVVSLAQAHALYKSSMVAVPPHKCHFWKDRNSNILDCCYAWSAAAWHKMKLFEKRRKKCAV
jgi:hypothetical protein